MGKPGLYGRPLDRVRLINPGQSLCFGALLGQPVERAESVAPQALRDGTPIWATVDAPWLAMADAGRFAATLAEVERLVPRRILGSHLPPAEGLTRTLRGHLDEARRAPAFVGPDQDALERVLAAA